MFHGYGMGTAKGAMHMAWTQIFYIKREALDMIRYDTLPIINYPGIIALNQFMLKRNNSKQISKQCCQHRTITLMKRSWMQDLLLEIIRLKKLEILFNHWYSNMPRALKIRFKGSHRSRLMHKIAAKTHDKNSWPALPWPNQPKTCSGNGATFQKDMNPCLTKVSASLFAHLGTG